MIAAVASRLALLALDPLERWAAARNPESFHWSALSQPTVWIPLMVVGGLGVAAVVVYRRHRLRRAMLEAFGRAASQADLSASERTMLLRIAEAADLRSLTDAHTLVSVFEDGVRQVTGDPMVQRLTPEARRRVLDVIASVRIKLDFAPTGPSMPREAALCRDDGVRVARPGDRQDAGATVIGVGDADVTVRLDAPLPLRVGGAALLRKVRGTTQWEYNLTVTKIDGDVVQARLIGSPARKNLRRFVRVPIQQPIHVAPYDFVHEGSDGRLPAFAQGTLREIAGPGLLAEIDLEAVVGERVLVVLDIGGGRSLRGVGVVRRSAAGDGERPPEVAIELTGMSEPEVARLVKETNAAARAAADDTVRPAARTASP